MFKTYNISVSFCNGNRTYTYRTHDLSIKVNDIVTVPVGESNDLKPAVVVGVFTLPPADCPVNKLKWVVGRASPSPTVAFWTQRTHLFRPDEFICSNCGYITTKKRLSECPKCSARMKKTKYDPSWVDEAEFFDCL